MKNRNLIIGVAVLVLIVVIGVGYFIFSSNKKQFQQPEAVSSSDESTDEAVNTLSPEDIGLTLTETTDGRKVVMEVSKVQDISSLEYQLSYTSKGGIPRGAIGTDITPKANMIKQEIVLGTCSDVCHYDEDISDIKIIIRVTKTDGRVYSVEQNI